MYIYTHVYIAGRGDVYIHIHTHVYVCSRYTCTHICVYIYTCICRMYK